MPAIPPSLADLAPDGPAASGVSFPDYPASWYFFGPVADFARRPVSREIFGQRLVAFRTASGRTAVLDARCSHLGTDLGCGRVVGERVQCPYHNWEYDTEGNCARIPASAEFPLSRGNGGSPSPSGMATCTFSMAGRRSSLCHFTMGWIPRS